MIKTKRCYCCKRILGRNSNNFHADKSKHDGLSGRCKECEKERSRSNKLKHSINNFNLQCKQDLSIKDYLKLLNKQQNKCAICNKKEIVKSRLGNIHRLSIDHDHRTNKIRGLLCGSCNLLLGILEEKRLNQSDIKKFFKYLKQHSIE